MSDVPTPKPDNDKKARMLKAISTQPPALPSMFIASKGDTSKAEAEGAGRPSGKKPSALASPTDAPDFRKLLRQGQKKDPVAGRKIREEEMVRCGYYLTALEQRQFKLLAVSNGHSMTELLRKAVQDYIRAHKHKLPKE
ncbi:MAG: hypothetical protein IH609_05890 [Dehalococcoidia bacterium]|uniref:Uncharacterized protein n=1 Tax=Aquamicrobium defluvii TaxID=69279 RepID=A0A011UFN9_9HYPH|nr:hypothetical protein [Aquamicrobium defluvii]EXL04961.1 hypothetical protein BG36_09200 [Aquamicrobium defluvii]EZQ14640.1 hypothetical protein CF98_19290 [Halopseudomonas bauzanensis]MBE0608886.1 hypothetical protein [Dehalococcoidia bacterium]MBE0608889.1 hypothetical protein [Dehalococcoidia bacterium]